jgi:hypothetical protein
MNTVTTEPKIEDFRTRQELFESDLPVYDKAQLLAQWDKEHAGQPPEKLRLNIGEREQLADYAARLKTLRIAHIELAGKIELYRQEADTNKTGIRRLEETVLPEETELIKSVIFRRCRQEILERFVNTAPKRLEDITRAVEDCLFHTDAIISRRFGANMQPGGRYFGATLPGKCDIAISIISEALNRK